MNNDNSIDGVRLKYDHDFSYSDNISRIILTRRFIEGHRSSSSGSNSNSNDYSRL